MKRLVAVLLAIGALANAQTPAPFNKTRVTFTNDGLTLVGYHYHPDGPGPFPTLIWNHGSEKNPGGGPQFDSVAKIFVPAGYAVFAPVRRGHTGSEGQYIVDTLGVLRAKRDGSDVPVLVHLHETQQLGDQLAGLAYAKTLPFVDKNRLVVGGCSFGGIQTLLAAERVKDFKAALPESPAAQSWAFNPPLQERLKTAVRNIDIPVFLIAPPKDANMDPPRVLGEEAAKAGKSRFVTKVYPPTMPDSEQVHCFGGAKGMHNWGSDAVAFFNAALGKPTDGYVTTSDSAKIYYRVSGRPGRGIDTLIAIHGGPGMDLESVYGDFAAMFGDKHVVIYYDQRGGGKSELPKDTTRLFAKRQVQDLDEIRRHFGLQRVTLVAHSYGPLLAASYAVAHPSNVKGMVFFGPVPPRRGDFFTRYGRNLNARLDSTQRAKMQSGSRRQNDDKLSEAESRQGCKDNWAIGLRPRLAEPDRTLPLLKSDLCATDVAGMRYGSRFGNRVIMGSYGDWDLRPQLARLQVPLLVVHGEEETIPMDLVEEWVTSMPAGRAQLMKVPRAAHFTYAERPELVWPAVEKFLTGLGGTP